MMTTVKPSVSSRDQPRAGALSLEQARAQIIGRLTPVATLERVPLRAALDRVLGEDVILPLGVAAPASGRRVGPADLGWLASLGRVEVCVRRRLRVAFFSLGEESSATDEDARQAVAHDDTRCMLYGMLAGIGAETLDLGTLPAAPRALRSALASAGADADAVIAIRGITIRSPGWVHEVMAEAGETGFIDVRVKPCRPVPFGRLDGGAAFFGFSSNPIPLAVMFHAIVRPALDHLAGVEPRRPLAFPARARAAFSGVPGWLNFRRGRLEAGDDGTPGVDLAAPADPGIVRTLRDANCFIVLPEDAGPVNPGDRVRVEPFADLFGA